MEHPVQPRLVKVLQLGCGASKIPGAIGIDINPRSAADILCDLDHFPYPFRDNVFDHVVCEHVLEHLDRLIPALEELHRITKPGGCIEIVAPYFSSIFFYRDPTHRIFFTAHTLDYFLPGTPVRAFHYTAVELRLLCVEFPPPPDASRLKRAFYRFLNRHIDFYEKHLAFILPRHTIRYELQVVKPEP